MDMRFECMNKESGVYSTTSIDITKEMAFTGICGDKNGIMTSNFYSRFSEPDLNIEAMRYSGLASFYSGDKKLEIAYCFAGENRPDFTLLFTDCTTQIYPQKVHEKSENGDIKDPKESQ